MRRSKLEPRKGECVCGRRLDRAAVYVYRSHSGRYVLHVCGCGREWTEHHTVFDSRDPVSSDEVIEVHTVLARFDGSISELFHLLST